MSNTPQSKTTPEQINTLIACVQMWVCMYQDKGEVPPEARLEAYLQSVKILTDLNKKAFFNEEVAA